MAFRMRGFSAFTKKTDPPGPNSTTDGDEVSGRTKIQELKNDLIEINKSIERHSDNKTIVAKLLESKKELQEALLKIEDK